jgi:mono/diheme cytochrome c family protein
MIRVGLLRPFLLTVAAGLIVPAAGRAADTKPSYDSSAALMGSATFKTYCASCHGKSGGGDGPLAKHLRFAPADLARIAKRNGGTFDFAKLAKVIDGRQPLKGHGGTDMPVWGDAFLQSREGYDAAKVKQKIDELVHYLASLQE